MSDAINTIALVFGLLLVLKKVADMERFYGLRLFLLTGVLCTFTIFLFLSVFAGFFHPGLSHCMPDINTEY